MAEEVYQPGENEATVLQKKKAENIRLADILYLIQGTGIDRDRQMTIEQLRDFLQDAFKMISMRGSSSATYVGLDGVEVGGTDARSKIGLEEASFVYGGNRIKISKDNLEINGNSFSLENGVISFSGKNSRVEICGDAIRLSSPSGKIELDSNGIGVSSPGGTVNLSRSGLVITDGAGNSVNVNSAGVSANRVSGVFGLSSSAVKVADSAKYNLARNYDGAVGDIVLVRSNSASDTAVQFTYNYQETGYKSCVLKPGCALAFYLKTFVKSEIRGIEFAEFVPVSNVTITTNNL